MAVTGFSLLLAAVSALAALATIPVPASAEDAAVVAGALRRVELPADELSDSLRPAEVPPPDFTAGQYIDSAGCVFVRTDEGWRGRVARDGTPFCGYPPTLSARRIGHEGGAALFPEPELPRARRIERDLTQAIIPNLQAGELVSGSAGQGGRGQGDAPATAAAALTAPPSPQGGASGDQLQLGTVIAKAPELSRQIAGAGRTDRLCALIGGGKPLPGAAGLGLCGAEPTSLAALSLNAPAVQAGVPTGEGDAKAKAGAKLQTGMAAKGARQSAGKIMAVGSPRPDRTALPASRPRPDDLRMIPPGARFVQVGSFRDPGQAQAGARKLAHMGMPVVRAREGAALLVLVGPLDGREAIVRMIERLRRAGYPDVRARR